MADDSRTTDRPGRVVPAERDAAVAALLPHVPFDGWTHRGVRMALAEIGVPADDAELLFPGGAADMIETFCDWADRRMEAEAATLDLAARRTHERVRSVIAPRPGVAGSAIECAACGRLCRSDRRCDLARGGRSVRGFQLVHQARDPWRRLCRDAALLAARQQRGRRCHADLPRSAACRHRPHRHSPPARRERVRPVAPGVTQGALS